MIARQPGRWFLRLGFGIGAATAGLVVVLALYGLAALVCALIPINRDYAPAREGVDVYLRSNGVHVDLVVPIKAGDVSWQTRLPLNALGVVPGVTTDLAFGWGDRGFYLATPTWADLQASTALWALTGVDTTVMHVEAASVPTGPQTRHVTLTSGDYTHLAAYIEAQFRHDATGGVIIVPGAHYGWHDAFFEAEGHYSAFKTCNEWTRQALSAAGVRVPLWSPFARALLFQLPED